MKTKKCEACGGPIDNKKRWKFCSDECNYSQHVTKWTKNGTTAGAYNELIVTADLMKNGFYVYRAVSPSSPCDLIAIHNGIVYRVEVTKGCKLKSGGHGWVRHDDRDYDILALAFNDDSIAYSISPKCRHSSAKDLPIFSNYENGPKCD